MISRVKILALFLLTLFTANAVEAKFQPAFGVSYAVSQPYPYNALTFGGIYQQNLFSNLSLECYLSPYWVLTAALGTDVIRWENDRWVTDPASNSAVTNVYLETWHFMGGLKFFPWGEIIVDDFWRMDPFITAEGGMLYLAAVESLDTIQGTTTGKLKYDTTAPMAGVGFGIEIGPPGEDEDNDLLQFFSRNIRFFAGLKYFVGFTPYNLRYFPLQFGLKLRI